MDKKRNRWFLVFFFLFLAAVIFGAWYYLNQKKREQIYEEVAKENYTEKTVQEPEEDLKEEEPVEESVAIPVDFAALKEKNPEIYGWIYIPETIVDYPILQRPEDDGYYLNHTMEGEEGLPGSIYTESLNKQDFSDKNTVIYGHNMKDETMFGSLKYYMDPTYMKQHEQIEIYTPEHSYTYRIFAAVTYDNRHILKSFDFHEDDQYQQFLDSLSQVRNMSSYINSEIPVTTEDRILTLSTCNSNNEQRFLVEAVLIDEK